MVEILNIREESWGIAIQIPNENYSLYELVFDRSALTNYYGISSDSSLSLISDKVSLESNLESLLLHKGVAKGILQTVED